MASLYYGKMFVEPFISVCAELMPVLVAYGTVTSLFAHTAPEHNPQ